MPPERPADRHIDQIPLNADMIAAGLLARGA